MYKIIGKYKGKWEDLDVFETLKEALEMMREYRVAYGDQWTIDVMRINNL